MPTTDIPLDHLSFMAYRLPGESGVRQDRSVFLSLGVWYEAEKFRAFAKELFAEAMCCPSLKEVRQLTNRNKRQWRGDWLAVQTRALACGMVYAAQADLHSNRWQGTAPELERHLECLALPPRVALSACQEFVRLRDSLRMAFLGGSAPHDLIGKRVHSLHKKTAGAWRLAHWQGRHGSWQIHDWALNQFVPITYLGQVDARLNSRHQAQLVGASDVVVVFERRKGKAMDPIIRGLKSLDCKVELELFSADLDETLGI